MIRQKFASNNNPYRQTHFKSDLGFGTYAKLTAMIIIPKDIQTPTQVLD